ncbi:hypothetical protein Tco_1350789, partial [Tanacetum coccineum]
AGIDFYMVDCLEGCGIGGGIRGGSDVGRIEGEFNEKIVSEFSAIVTSDLFNVYVKLCLDICVKVEVDVAKVVDGVCVVDAAKGDVGVDASDKKKLIELILKLIHPRMHKRIY